jgi:hypothetical protein
MVVAAALGADIVPGDFIVAKRHDSSNVVCNVRRVVLPHSLEVVWWRETNKAPSVCPNLYQNVVRSRVREIYADESATSVIPCESIVDIAFVFSAEVLEHIWTDVGGMTRVFFTRTMNHIPFSLNVSESYPSRIWFSLLSVKDLVRKMMSCKRQMHLCKRAETIPLSLECWRYLSKFMKPVCFEKFQTKAHQYSDLSLQSKSSVKNCSVIRIINQDTMQTARGIFGTTFGIGTRNIPPRKGNPRKVLEVGNIINLVELTEPEPEPPRKKKFKEFISNQRIDLLFEEATRMLTVRITYSDLKAEAPIVSDILGFPRVDVTPTSNNPARHARRVEAVPNDTLFLYNDKLFTVTDSDGDRVYAICAEDGEQICLENNFLWDLILER